MKKIVMGLLCLLSMLAVVHAAKPVAADAAGTTGLTDAEVLNLNGKWAFLQTTYLPPIELSQSFEDVEQVDLFESKTLDRQIVQVPGMLNKQPDAGIIGFYRKTFDYPYDTSEAAVYISNIRHADVVWINRQQVGATGKIVPPWQFQVNNPQSLPRLYQIPAGLLQKTQNTITIQVELGFAEALAAIYPGGTGITQGKVLVGNQHYLKTRHSTKTLQTIFADAIFVVLGVVDVILIAFLLKFALNRFPGYLWLVINSIMMMLASGAQDIFFVLNMHVIGSNLGFVIIFLMLPLVNALFFRSSRKDIAITWVYAFTALSVFITAVIVIPHQWAELKKSAWLLYIITATILYGYCIYAAVDNVIKKRTGAALQLFGLLFYLISIRSQWLPDGLFDHRNVQIGTMVFRYLLFFSYVRQFMEIKKGYNASVQKILSIDKLTRNAIAMELHDGVIQRLASIRLLSQLIKKDAAEQQIMPDKHLNNLTTEVDSAIATIRSTMAHTHDQCFEQFSVQEILAQDAKRLQNIYQCRLTWELSEWDDSSKTLNYSAQQWAHIYRIMHECVLNAIKHGGADNIHLTGKEKGNLVIFTVENDGTPFTLADTLRPGKFGDGHGWTAIRERVALLNAEINVYNNFSNRTVVELRCPTAVLLSEKLDEGYII